MNKMDDKNTTSVLLGKLKNSSSVEEFLSNYGAELETVEFRTVANRFLSNKNCSIREICARTSMNESYCYQLFNGVRKPSRDKIIQISFGMKLGLEEANKLLKAGGKNELYCKDKRDAVIIFGLNNRLSLIDVEVILEQKNLEAIVKPD